MGRNKLTNDITKIGPWVYVNTNAGYAIIGDYVSSSGIAMRRYIAQLIPDEEIARLMANAKEMKALLEDVAQYIADERVDEGAGYQGIDGQSPCRKICNLLRRLKNG